jgi:hypothetical protein
MTALRALIPEIPLEVAREVPLQDMTQAELCSVILNDPDINERRTALRLLKLEILLDAENKMFNVLAEMRKS